MMNIEKFIGYNLNLITRIEMYDDYPKIVMYDVSNKYVPELKDDMLKKYYVHVAATIEDKELKKKTENYLKIQLNGFQKIKIFK